MNIIITKIIAKYHTHCESNKNNVDKKYLSDITPVALLKFECIALLNIFHLLFITK